MRLGTSHVDVAHCIVLYATTCIKLQSHKVTKGLSSTSPHTVINCDRNCVLKRMFFFPLIYAFAFLSTELLKDLLQERPVEETGVDAIIVVDNAPKVGPDRMGKLKLVLNKVFARFGEIVTQEYPTDEKGVFKG